MKGWATLKNDRATAHVFVDCENGWITFIRGYVESGMPGSLDIVHLGAKGLRELDDYGFEYPDYVADITEQLENHEQEKPHEFI